MLKLLRDKGIQKKIYYGLTVAVVLTFVVSGVLVSQDDGKASSSLAKFENRKISVGEYLNSYKAVQRQASMMYGDRLNEMRERLNFKSEAWDRLLLLEYARKHGIRAGDGDVVEWITRQEAFKSDGKFDDKLYRMYAERALRSTPRQFEEEIRQMLTLGKVQEKLKEGLNLPDEDVKKAYLEENTEKDLLYGLLPLETFLAEALAGVSDEQVKQLEDVVKNKLTDEKTGETLTEEQVKEEIKKKTAQGKASELALKKMNELREKIRSPADFETVLKAGGVTPEKADKYKKGVYPAGIWPSENLYNAVQLLKPDEISPVFSVPKGAMIAKVTAVYAPDEKKFEEGKKNFREQMESQKSAEKLSQVLDEMREKLSLNLELMKELFPVETVDGRQ